MTGKITLTGMVLKTMPVGEYDRRIVLLTRERGKVAAFVRGARRPKSSLQAASNIFCFGVFEAYEGKNSYTVTGASIQKSFSEMSLDLDRMYYGCYFLEAAEYFTSENDDASEQLNLLYATLQALLKGLVKPKLIRRIYELKLLYFNGTYPDFFSCAVCGKKDGLVWFDETKNRMICASCHPDSYGFRLDPAAVYALQFIIASPVSRLYSFTVTDAVYEQMRRVIDRCFRIYLERPLKSAAFLEGA